MIEVLQQVKDIHNNRIIGSRIISAGHGCWGEPDNSYCKCVYIKGEWKDVWDDNYILHDNKNVIKVFLFKWEMKGYYDELTKKIIRVSEFRELNKEEQEELDRVNKLFEGIDLKNSNIFLE